MVFLIAYYVIPLVYGGFVLFVANLLLEKPLLGTNKFITEVFYFTAFVVGGALLLFLIPYGWEYDDLLENGKILAAAYALYVVFRYLPSAVNSLFSRKRSQ